MNIVTDNININKIMNSNVYQITLDDDFIVSDTKPDIDKIIREQGEVIIDEFKIHNEKLEVRGRLKCTILYVSEYENGTIHSITEMLSFNEIVNLPDVENNTNISLKGNLDDLSVGIINSRKISIKGLVTLYIKEEVIEAKKAVVGIEECDDVQTLERQMGYSRLVVNKKDIFRIKEEIQLQSSKNNILEILYSDVRIINYDTRLLNEKIGIKGELSVFIVYKTEDDEYECLEKEIPYSGEVDVSGIDENMIDDNEVKLAEKDINVKPDDDGEKRIIDVDVMLDLGIKIYNEEYLNILQDIYSIQRKLMPIIDKVECMKLLLKNNTAFRVNEKINLKEQNRDILQVCNSVANIKMDDINIVENGIGIEGIIEINILYISNNNEKPLNSLQEIIPFSHIIEVKGINKDCIYDVKPYIEQIGIAMLTGNDIEIKAGINLDTIVFENVEENIISDIEMKDFTKEEMNSMCLMIGYLVKDGDNLWTVAKKFYTTVDMLREINKIVDKDIKKGDKLLIVKKC